MVRLFALVAACALVLALAAPAAAQSTSKAFGDWSDVQSLSPGQKIVVRTKDGDRLAGRFDSATDLLINFTHDGRKVSLTRESIRRVQLNRGKSHGRGALLGAAIGAGVGFAAGGIVYFPNKDDIIGATVPGAMALGAGIGAGIGAALGKGNKNETVYEAP
ncbi:MAG: hypothetical protein H7Z38_13890 [Rubrivivax sp.]|nr:hypothetical protein [Pyrinomonadaceae bacterium]